MAGTIKVDSINADSNLTLKIANTAVAFIDATGLRPTSGNVNLDATATSKLYLPSANTVAIQTAGVTAVTVDSSQNVTLAGTLTTTGITNSGVATGARFNPTGSSATGNGMYLPAANSLGLSTNGTNAVYIDSSQNVGIGTASPSFTAGSNGVMISGTKPALRLSSTTTGSGTWEIYADSASSGGLGFYERQNNQTLMYIDEGGNVGIGTSSPSAKLHVSGGQSYVTGASSAGAYSRWYNNAQTTGDFQVGQGWLSVSDNIGVLCNNANAAMILGTNGTERMRIDSSGRVCIGVNSAAYSTACAMNVNVDTVSASGGAWVSKAASTSTAFHMNFQNGNGGVGGISTSGSATQYVTSSDYRLKENITPMTGALAKVAQLKPVTYKWKVDGSDGEGFIAHELAEVKPDCVSGDKDAVDADGNPVYQGIDVSFLVATLTAALQETKALIDTQAETINALTANLTALTARITALESTP